MCPDHDERTDDLDRRRFLEATAGTAGLVGGVGIGSAIGARETVSADADAPTPDRSLAGTAGDSEGAPPNGTFTAVIDRFEDDRAVLVLERDGETAGELVIDAERLPDDGRKVDAVFEVVLSEGAPTDVAFRPERTEHRAESAQRRFDRLSRPTCDDAR